MKGRQKKLKEKGERKEGRKDREKLGDRKEKTTR